MQHVARTIDDAKEKSLDLMQDKYLIRKFLPVSYQTSHRPTLMEQ